MIDPTNVHSISDFKRNTPAHLRRLKRTGKPEVLTTNGRSTLVIQDAESYEKQMRELVQRRLESMLLEGMAGKGVELTPQQLKTRLQSHLKTLSGKSRK